MRIWFHIQFEGSVVNDNGDKEMLDISNLVLRGCTLRKTEWIVGAVVFAGVETKIQCNQSAAPRKVTHLEGHMNLLVVLVFVIQVIHSITPLFPPVLFNMKSIQICQVQSTTCRL